MITLFLIDLLDFAKLLVIDFPVVLFQIIVLRNKEYSIWGLFLNMVSLHPLLTLATIAIAGYLLIGEVNAKQDEYMQEHRDSKTLAFVQKVSDEVYVFGDKVFNYAERNEARLCNPRRIRRFYEENLSNRTYWERRMHKHELNMRLIAERKARLSGESPEIINSEIIR